ncbi:gamma-crystallin N [Babesia caballi]|uniref:Gamma-crystallin N n=1 Tax=Babesia caballi TaxID=5871 RepID=A0AAV4LLD7_BABCB|nr:gamma-crystallin N [Babesia caballi]
MASGQAAKRRCTPGARKKLLQTTKEVCAKRLSELTEEELGSYLQTLGWPKALTAAAEAYGGQRNFVVWVLNRMLTQLKKWASFQAGAKHGGDGGATEGEAGESSGQEAGLRRVTVFRTLETRLVAYLVAHTSDINALHAHSHLLVKMATLNSTWRQIGLEELGKREFENECLRALEAPNAEEAVSQYRDAVEAVNELLRAVYYQPPPMDGTPRNGNRVYMALSLNDVAEKLLDGVTTFVLWNHAFQTLKPAQVSKKVATDVGWITCAVAEHLGTMSEILCELLEASSNAKSAYNCAAQTLMGHLLLLRAEYEDFRAHVRLLFKKRGNAVKDSVGEILDQRVTASARSLMRVLTFPLAPKFAAGLKEMLRSQEYVDLLDVDQLGNMDLEDSAVTYSRRFLLNIVAAVHRAEGQAAALQQARGVCIALPEIFEVAVDAMVAQGEEEHDGSFYGAMILALVAPLVIRLARSTRATVETQPESCVPYAALADSVWVFCKLLNVANSKQVLVYSGERSELVAKTNGQAMEFVMQSLVAAYGQVEKARNRKVLMGAAQEEERAMRLQIKRTHAEHPEQAAVVAVIQTIPRLWDALLLLASLSLEYADENMQQILHLLSRDYAFHNNDHYEEEAFAVLIKPKVQPRGGETSRKSEVFAASLVSMYSHANDMTALVDHMGEFVEGGGEASKERLFMAHPSAIQAFHSSSAESSPSQIPIVIRHFVGWLSKKRARAFMQYPLMCYLRGIELSSTLVERTSDAFEELLEAVPLEPSPQGVLMALHLLLTIRKIKAWSSVDRATGRWDTHLKRLYGYLGELKEAVGVDCSLAIWTALFWFAYHFTLLIRDQPGAYGSMREGINGVVVKLGQAVRAKTGDQSFMTAVNALLAENAHVFDEVESYTAVIKAVSAALTGFEKNERLLDDFKGTIEVLSRGRKLINEVFDLDFVHNILAVSLDQGSTASLRLKAVGIVRQVLENSAAICRHEGFARVLHTLAAVMRQVAAGGDVGRAELMEAVVGLTNFILRREEQLGIQTCALALVRDCIGSVEQGQGGDILRALNSVKGAVDLTQLDALQRSLAVIQQVANVHTFVMVKMAGEAFTKFVELGADSQSRRGLVDEYLAIVVPTVLTEEAPQEGGSHEPLDEGTSAPSKERLVDAALFANIVKNLEEKSRASVHVDLPRVVYKLSLSEVLVEMGKAMASNNPTSEAQLLYLSSVLYGMAASGKADQKEGVLETVATMHTHVRALQHIRADVLEAAYEALLEAVYRVISNTPTKEIQEHAVHALFFLACAQHAIYFKRRGSLGYGGTQLEIFRALCGCQVEKLAEVVEGIFDNADLKQTWNSFTAQLESIYQQAEAQDAPHDWMFRAGALEVLILVMDRSHLKTLYSVRGPGKKRLLGVFDALLSIHTKHMERLADDAAKRQSAETMHWLVLNYLINTAISIKIFVFTRFQVHKQMQATHGAVSEHLLDLARLGVRFLKVCRADGLDDAVFEQIATNVYLALYNCIRTGRGGRGVVDGACSGGDEQRAGREAREALDAARARGGLHYHSVRRAHGGRRRRHVRVRGAVDGPTLGRPAR